jgi:hypothetical protein
MTIRDERDCFIQKVFEWSKSNPRILNIIVTLSPHRTGAVSAVEIELLTPDSTSIRIIPGINDLKLSMVVERARGYLKEELEEILSIMNELRKLYTQCLREVG